MDENTGCKMVKCGLPNNNNSKYPVLLSLLLFSLFKFKVNEKVHENAAIEYNKLSVF